MNIKIIGNGAWGSSIYEVLKTNINNVSVWDKKESLDDYDLLVLSVPVQSLREAVNNFKGIKKDVIVVNSAKGIEKNSHKFPYEIIQELLGGKKIHYYSLIGPTFAREVKQKMPTVANLGYKDTIYNEQLLTLFNTNYFQIKLTPYYRIIELFGALKNIIAICCGITDGLGFNTNTRVKLILNGFEEINTLAKALGFSYDASCLPGTMGDLILTCSSIESRNFQFGKLLVKFSVKDCLKEVKETVEGYYSVDSIPFIEDKYNIKLPLLHFVNQVVGTNNPKEVKNLFDQYIKTY